MTAIVRIARITAEPLDLAEHVAAVSDRDMGAVTTFIGTVRDADPDAAGEVVALEYSSHPDAERVLHTLAETSDEGCQREAAHADDRGPIVAVSHRIGRLEVGDAAVVIAVAAVHRAEAFAACRALIERIKTDLPIWKRQIEADGSTAWKGLGG